MTDISHISNTSLKASLQEGVKQGFYAFYSLLRVMIPVYIVIAVLKELNIVDWLSVFFAPYMKFFGLPGEAALVIVSGWTINLYAAVAALAGLSFTARQVTILAVMMGITHSLVMETAIITRMKGRPMIVLIFRIAMGILAGVLMNLILPSRL